jgi:hypothetical protein
MVGMGMGSADTFQFRRVKTVAVDFGNDPIQFQPQTRIY